MEIITVVSLCILVGAVALVTGFIWGRDLSPRYICRSALLRCGLVKPTEAEVFRRNFESRMRQPIHYPTITPESEAMVQIDPEAWRE